MIERKTLKISTGPKTDAGDPRDSWGVKGKRLDRLHDMARDRRRNPTDAEKLLWTRLANQKLGGFKFKKQYIVGTSIVDFACPTVWLVVEIDDLDIDAELQAMSDRKLAEVGVRVLRFTNEAVLEDVDAVCAEILEMLKTPFEKPRRPRTPPVTPVADAYNAGY
ncbi:endonuclease domain-containing protein [Allopontixanthobacter sediminis]|uniref:DUF559 domain-containing protein n=1 Tax=Allopontixanthobacter sediminis TaxID=1689985 RepID=A0A845B2U5_9SPHN|nr:DUF559 domain-containing protein [Allopontixanthobacter sediminis]MXP44506.1 DUF559 domain-containing protein [Allopontixanthobacter sediminis]